MTPVIRRSGITRVSDTTSNGSRINDSALELTLFGTLAARHAGSDLPLRLPRNAQRLLAYLLLHRERAQSRERVAFLLWPDDDETDARTNLRRQLHLLQRALPGGDGAWITTTATSMVWNAKAACTLDIAEFERLSADIEFADAADRLYVGDLLPELDDEWLIVERDRLRLLALQNCAALLRRCEQRRDFRSAIRYAQRMRSFDPWREDAVRALIDLRLQAGDRAGALAEYERFQAALLAEMGVEPMPETLSAYERAVADAGPLLPTSLATDERATTRTANTQLSGPTYGLPFVGRRIELERLEAHWVAASTGTGTTTLVVGEAGIGKSRLISALATHAESNGGRIVRGGTSPFELGPYQPIAEALRSALPMLRKAKIEPIWLAALVPLVPQLAVEFPKLPPLPALDAEAERTRLFEAVALALAALAVARPMLVILEDLHWAGSATIALLEYLARRAPRDRIFIVASYRDGDLAHTSALRAVRRRLERERLLQVTALGAMTAADVEEIVAHLSDEAPERRMKLAKDLLVASDGNAFILGELVMNERHTGLLDDSTRTWNRAVVPRGVAPSLTAVLLERIDRLPPRTRSVIEIASVIGNSFSAELVREVIGLDEHTSSASLSLLVDQRLVREVDNTDTDFVFSHQIIQQTVYAKMSPDARTRRHRRIGNIFEEIYSAHIEQFAAELASHYDQGREPERAAQYYLIAARQALALYGNDEAKTLACRGLELVNDVEAEVALLEVIEEAHRRLGERDEQRRIVGDLLRLAHANDNPEMLREALRRSVVLAHSCGEREEERAAIAALEVQTRNAPAPWGAIVGQLKSLYLLTIGSYAQARASITQALALPSLHEYPKLLVACRCTLVKLSGCDGRISQIQSFLSELTENDRQRYGDALYATLLEAACSGASNLQDYAALARTAEQLRECSHAIGYREGEAAAYRYAGRAAFRLFEPERAQVFLTLALSMFDSIDHRFECILVLGDLGNLATSIGQFDEAIQRHKKAESLAESISFRFGQAACANNISYAACLQGDFIEARTSAERALIIADELNAPPIRAHALVNLGVAKRELGDISAAIQDLEAGIALERELSEAVAIGEDISELILALVRAQRLTRALELADEILAYIDSLTNFTHPQFLLWSAAVAHYASGDVERAGTLLIGAHAALEKRQSEIQDVASQDTFRKLPYNYAIDQAFNLGIWNV